MVCAAVDKAVELVVRVGVQGRGLRLGLERPRGRVGLEHVPRRRLVAPQGRRRRRQRLDEETQLRPAVARPPQPPVRPGREEAAPVRRVGDRLETARAVDDVAPRESPPQHDLVLVVVAHDE